MTRILALVFLTLVGCLAFTSGAFAIDVGIEKIPFVNLVPVIDGIADPMWLAVKSYCFDFLWMGESGPDNPVLDIQIARDQANLYGFVKTQGIQSSPTNWDEWQIGNFVVVCFAPNGRHRLPFQATDSEVVLRHDGAKLCKPTNGSLSDVAGSAIRTNTNGWDAEFSVPLTTLGYNGSETVGLAISLRQVGPDGHPKFLGSVENSPIAIDRPSTWQSVPMELEYETLWVTDKNFKATPDGVEAQSNLFWHVTDSSSQSFSCQQMLRKGWLEVTCLPGVPCPSNDAIVTHLKGTFTTDANGVRRLLANEVSYFGGLPVVRPVAGNSKALSALNAGLFFSLTGKVTDSTVGGFTINDDGVPVSIVGNLPPDIAVGDTVTVCGTSHLGGTGSYLSFTNAIRR